MGKRRLDAEVAVAPQSPALPLEGVEHVRQVDGLAPGMICIHRGVGDDLLQELLEDVTHFLVDQAREALDPSAAGQAANGGLGDAEDIVLEDLLALETLASLAASVSLACYLGLVWRLKGRKGGI